MLVRAFVVGWLKGSPEALEFQGSDSEVVDQLVVKANKREAFNKSIAELFGVVATYVKTFPTNSGWIILDKQTKRMLHKDLKNQNEVEELCRKYNYIK